MDPLSVLIGWGEKLVSGFRKAARTDVRIADQARLVRRQLAASFEDWPHGPKTDDDLLSWAYKLARGFNVTQPMIDGLVSLRPEASRSVSRAVAAARDDYYAAADLISPSLKTVPGDDGYAGTRVDHAQLRKGYARIKRCIALLDGVIARASR